MAYRKRDKPPFAAWLVSQREHHGWKAEEVAKRLRDAGHQAEDSTYRTWESSADRRPAQETVAALERMFGAQAPGTDELATGDLAAAINDLVAELRAWREEDRRELARLGLMVQQLAAGALETAATPGAPAPRTHGGSAG
jgi:hypothetical protein